jgi:hypothetical protein
MSFDCDSSVNLLFNLFYNSAEKTFLVKRKKPKTTFSCICSESCLHSAQMREGKRGNHGSASTLSAGEYTL